MLKKMQKIPWNNHNSIKHNIFLLKESIENRPYDDHTVDFCVFVLKNYGPSICLNDFILFAVFYMQSRGPYDPDCLHIIREHFSKNVTLYENFFEKDYLLFKFLSHFTYLERIEFSKFKWLDFVVFVHKQGFWSDKFYSSLTINERVHFEEKCKRWSQIKQKMFQKSVVK